MPENLNNKGYGVVPILLAVATLGAASFVGINFFLSKSDVGDVLQSSTSSKPVPCTSGPTNNNAFLFRNGRNCFYTFRSTSYQPSVLDGVERLQLSAKNSKPSKPNPFPNFVRPPRNSNVYFNGFVVSNSVSIGFVSQIALPTAITLTDNKYGDIQVRVHRNVIEYSKEGNRLTNPLTVVEKLSGPRVTAKKGIFGVGNVLLLRGEDANATIDSSLFEIVTSGYVASIVSPTVTPSASPTPTGTQPDNDLPDYALADPYVYTSESGKWPQTLDTYMEQFIGNNLPLINATINNYYRTSAGIAALIDVPGKACVFLPNGQRPKAQKAGQASYDLYDDVYILTPNRLGGYQAIAQTSGPKIKPRILPGVFERCGVIFFRKNTPLPF